MNRNDYDYEEDDRVSLLNKIGIAIFVILGIVILFFMVKGCVNKENTNNNNTNDTPLVENDDLSEILLSAGKEFFEINKYLLPGLNGSCNQVDLSILKLQGLIDETKFEDCDDSETYVKVCKLDSGDYKFIPVLSCSGNKTSYGEWTEGKETDIKENYDIKYVYKAEYLDIKNSSLGKTVEAWEDEVNTSGYKIESSTKYYRYKDLQYIWSIKSNRYYSTKGDVAEEQNAKEYYVSSPASGYINKTAQNSSVAKYFKTTGTKDYWTDSKGVKQYKTVAPDNVHIYRDDSSAVSETRYRTRTWNEVSKPTESEPYMKYVCTSANSSTKLHLFTECETNTENPEFNHTERIYYTCDGVTEVSSTTKCHRCADGQGKLRDDGTSCGSYGDWTGYTSNVCDTKSDLCESLTITVFNWYSLSDGTRSYYPSGKSKASEEKVYYATAPAEGYTRDANTITTGWKWYKKVETKTSEYYATAPQAGAVKTSASKWTDWSSWSTIEPKSLGASGTREIETRTKLKLREITNISSYTWKSLNEEYLSEQDLIKLLQSKGYKVNSLKDIDLSSDLRYSVKMLYREVK